MRFSLTVAFCVASLRAQDCPFQLVAGPPIGGPLEGVPANQAWLQGPTGTAVDAAGNLYVAATYDNRILRVGSDNIIHVIAGTGVSGSAGDGGSALQAQLAQPVFVLAAPDGTLYISDTGNNRIRRLMQDGTIVAVAGTGHPGFSGDGGSTLSAELSGPTGLALDANGALYIADTGNNRIRKVSANGTMATVAGTDQSCSSCVMGDKRLPRLYSRLEVWRSGRTDQYTSRTLGIASCGAWVPTAS